MGETGKPDEQEPFDLTSFYKFPRLKDKYVSVFRGGDSEEDAIKKVERALLLKNVFNPLDKTNVFVYEWTNSGFKFEAHVHYLASKFEKELTEVEKRRWKGLLSKILIVDDDDDFLLSLVNYARSVGRYEIDTCRTSINVVQAVADYAPEVLVLKHNMSGINGVEVAKRIRQTGLVQKTIAFGQAKHEFIKEYYTKNLAWYFIKEPYRRQITDTLEKVLNGIKPKEFGEFLIP